MKKRSWNRRIKFPDFAEKVSLVVWTFRAVFTPAVIQYALTMNNTFQLAIRAWIAMECYCLCQTARHFYSKWMSLVSTIYWKKAAQLMENKVAQSVGLVWKWCLTYSNCHFIKDFEENFLVLRFLWLSRMYLMLVKRWFVFVEYVRHNDGAKLT